MIVERTTDKTLISNFILECLNEIVEDETYENAIVINTESDCWLAISENEQILAVMQVSPYNRSILEIHPYIPDGNRHRSEAIGKASVAWVKADSPEQYQTLITNTPAFKRHVRIYARRMGFKEVGRYENGFKKNGVYHDMVLYQQRIR